MRPALQTQPALEVCGLGYRYPRADADALQGVDLGFPSGSFTAILGSTGAGKSTLAMALNGVIPQLKEGTLTGQVLLDGADLAGYRVQTITEYVGLVLQDPDSQLLGRTVAEDVAFGPRNHRLPRAEVLRRVAASLATVGLAGLEDRATAQLSGGERQRLALAGVLALQPQVLCLDEPTSELDPQGRDEVYQAVDRLRDQGRTIIAVEHTGGDVLGRADRLVVLDRGRVAWQGSPEVFYRDPDLVAAHHVRPLPMAAVGQELAAAGLVPADRIPLTVDDAEALVRRLAGGRPVPAPVAEPDGDPAPNGEVVLQASDLVHRYPGGQAGLAGVDLTIRRGEYLALVGRNGAGKTTLAKHFNGLLRPGSGSVAVEGRDAAGLPVWELAGRVGYVFQNPDHQIFCPRVDAEVRYGLELAGLPSAEVEARVDEVLAATGLAAVRDQHPFSLPKGTRQRIAVASILALRPAILVVDEPTTGQDWPGAQDLMALIDRLNADGTTIVLIGHDLDLVARHARRMVVLEEGRVVVDGPTAEVLAAGVPGVTSQAADLSGRLWPGSRPLLDEAALGRHLAVVLGQRR